MDKLPPEVYENTRIEITWVDPTGDVTGSYDDASVTVCHTVGFYKTTYALYDGFDVVVVSQHRSDDPDVHNNGWFAVPLSYITHCSLLPAPAQSTINTGG